MCEFNYQHKIKPKSVVYSNVDKVEIIQTCFFNLFVQGIHSIMLIFCFLRSAIRNRQFLTYSVHFWDKYSKMLQKARYINQNLRLVFKISVVRKQTTLPPVVKEVSRDFTHSLTSNNELFL